MVLEMAQAFVEIFGTFGSSTLGDCKIISTWRIFGIFSFFTRNANFFFLENFNEARAK
jgi:hypothetical protein